MTREPAVDVATLRRGFKAVCKATENRFQNFQIRVHRSLSWFERAQELDRREQPDGRLLYGWIALSSLYGTWCPESGHAVRDGESRQAFLDMLLEIDQGCRLAEQLELLREDVLWVLENKFLDPRFWQDPEHPGNVRAQYHRGVRVYYEKNWHLLLDYTFERIAVLRGQIVHGAATRGSRLNRESLSRCTKVLEALLPVILQLVIEHRADDDWPPLCYPPIEEP
jgi:hypothetical protein